VGNRSCRRIASGRYARRNRERNGHGLDGQIRLVLTLFNISAGSVAVVHKAALSGPSDVLGCHRRPLQGRAGIGMVEQRVQRRLAAILAGDVAGYSRLMGADEEGTLSRLNALRREFLEPKIADYRGRVVKRTGDGVLIEFASAVDATRCAIEIQNGMVERNASVPQNKRIELRIGIHVGDIIIEDEDIFGGGINIAARLESIAYPGGICISDDAYRQVHGKLNTNFQDTGSVRKAGKRVRVTCQLIEARTGAHLWAERYDRRLDDIFALQDELTLAVVKADIQ
jgi:class 3 adenylate cyclase